MSMQHLQEGLDPTPLECITKADILQMIRAAKPYPHQGFTIKQSTAPDVVTNPELADFLWIKTVDDTDYIPVDPAEVYIFDGTAWIDITSVDGSRLIAGSVALAALSLDGSNPLDILQVDSNGLNLVWTSIVNAIQNNTIPVDKLLKTIDSSKYLLTALSGVKAWTLLSTFFTTTVDDGLIPIAKLLGAGASTLGKFAKTASAGGNPIWAALDLADIAAAGFSAGDSIRRNSSNTGWEAIPTQSVQEAYASDSGVGTTIELSLTKPAGKKWKTIELKYTNAVDDGSPGGGTVAADFSWQTAPLAGNGVTVGPSNGCGNNAQVYTVNDVSDALSTLWHYAGIVPAQLVDTNIITVRVTLTATSGLVINSGNFTARGTYA